jgi:hypothetical protein
MSHENDLQNKNKKAGQFAATPTAYEVGYKKPPRHTRFQPGQSGNPKGRPKRSRNLDIMFEEELNAPVKIREDGRPRTVSKKRVFVTQTVHRAIQGDARAAAFVIKMIDKIDCRRAYRTETSLSNENLETLLELREIFNSAEPKITPPEPGNP